MESLALAKERYSVRKPADKPVEQKKIDKIIETPLLAPTAKNIQLFKIWVMQSLEAQDLGRGFYGA